MHIFSDLRQQIHYRDLETRLHNECKCHEKESEPRTTAASASLHLTGRSKSSRDFHIKRIILHGPNKDASKISEDQRESCRFTTVISISLPTQRNKTAADTKEKLQEDTDIDRTHETVNKTTNQHRTELRDRFSTTDTCRESFKDGDGPKSPFDEDSFSTLQSQYGFKTPNQARDTGLQHNLGPPEQAQRVHDNSQRHSTRPVCVKQTDVSKGTNANEESGANDRTENGPTTPQNHSNLTSLGKDSRLKASTDSELSACSSAVLSQDLSLSSLHIPLSESTSKPEQSRLNPASVMLASALATVLAPPWSGRFRRPKQGGSEVEHEPQDCGHNVNPPASLHQDRRQQPFLSFQRQRAERVVRDPNDNDMQFTARTRYSSPDWQKDSNSPKVTTATPSKRAIMKSSFVDSCRATMHNSAELHHVRTPLDNGQVPKMPHSQERRGYRMSKTEDQNEPFKPLSSKPTTSSLLLSLRRANLRRSNAETTQIQTQTTRSIGSFTLHGRGILKNAKTCSVNPDDQARDTLGSYSFTKTFPKTSKTEGISDTSNYHFSPRSKRIMSRPSLFLHNKETAISKNPVASVARDDEQHFPNSTTKSSPHEIFKAQPHFHSLVLRKYSNTEGDDPVELSTANSANQHNSNINNNRDTFSQNSYKDRANISPKRERFSVDENLGGQTFWDSKKSQSCQIPMDLSSPLSLRRSMRGFCVPPIYSYLRESSPAIFTPNSPSTPSSQNSSYALQGGGEIMQGNQKRFSFDISPVEPKAHGPSSIPIGPAQSLPPDFGRKSTPRLSTSPYSTLISSRPALSSTLRSAPPVSKLHDKSTSYDTLTIRVYPIKGDPSASPSMCKSITNRPKEQLGSPDRKQKTANPVQASLCAQDNHKPVQPCLSRAAPHPSFVMKSSSTNITPHPRQQNTTSHEEHERQNLTAVQLNKVNSYSKHRLSQKGNTVTAKNETQRTAETEMTDSNTLKRLQEIPNSKKGLFALRVKKDNVPTSDTVADKDDVTPQYFKTKRNLPVLKTSNKIDQILNLFKQKFGGKRSANTVDIKNKTTTHQPLGTEIFEQPKTEEKKCFEGQCKPSLINDKSSLTSLSPRGLMKSENTLNVDGQNWVKSKKQHLGNRSEAPNLRLTTGEASLPSQESLSPLTLRKFENTIYVDRQNRVKCGKRFGSQWEAPNSSLTTDKASYQSLSALTFRKSKETLNVDQHKRWSDEHGKQSYSSLQRLKAHSMSRSATLPQYTNTTAGPPSLFNLFDYDSQYIHNDNVFHTSVSKTGISVCECDSSPQMSSIKSTVHQNPSRSRISASCAELKYGLNNGRSFSISSVVSSRPSGPGRISTSRNDFSSLDDLTQRGKYSKFNSLINVNYSPAYGAKSAISNQFQPRCTLSDDHLQNTDKQQNSSCFWGNADPTPPPSPTFPPSCRISQSASVSSPRWRSPDSPSPRGILPPKSYSSNLTVFEESSSDTTTDDEYYLDNGDEVETEL